MKKLPLLLIPIIIIVVVALKASNMKQSQPDDGYFFSGTAETTKVRLSFKTSGRISKIIFDEGDNITEKDVVAILDSTDEKLNIAAAEANLEYNNAMLAEVLAGSRKQEIRNAKAAMDIAKAKVRNAETELSQASTDRDRFKSLYADNGISKRTYELYETAYKKALNNTEEAKAATRKANETLSLAIEGARSEAIAKAKAMVSISEQSLIQSKQRLEYTNLISPISGKVLTRVAEDGEFIQTGAVVLTIANIKDLWVRGFVSESYLGKIKIGQEVVIKTDSYPDKEYLGKITYISDEAEFTPKSVQTYDERINFMYMIKVTTGNDDMELKQGMPVEGKIIF